MPDEQKQQEDYLARVKLAAPKVDAILKEHLLNLGAQFDSTRWPRALNPVPIYIDVKDYSEPKAEPMEGHTTDEPVESPIQREDLDATK